MINSFLIIFSIYKNKFVDLISNNDTLSDTEISSELNNEIIINIINSELIEN